MSKFDGFDAVLGDLVNGQSAFNRVPGSPRKPGIEGFGLWVGATAPPPAPRPRAVVRKLDRAVFDPDREARLRRERRYGSEQERRGLPRPGRRHDEDEDPATEWAPRRSQIAEADTLTRFAGLDSLDNNLDCAESLTPSRDDELVPLADDPAVLDSLASLDRGVFDSGSPLDADVERDEPATPLVARGVAPEPHGDQVPLQDDPALLDSLVRLDEGVFGDVRPHDTDGQRDELLARLVAPEPPRARPSRRSTKLLEKSRDEGAGALDSLADLDSLDRNLDGPVVSTPEPDNEVTPLADDPALIESLARLDHGVFGGGSPQDRRIQRYELKTRLVKPAPLPGLVADASSVRMHRWVAAATLVSALLLGAAAAAYVFQQQLSLIAARWRTPANAVPATESCAAGDCLPERNR